MRIKARRTMATIGVGLIALVAAGCGSGSGKSSSNTSAGNQATIGVGLIALVAAGCGSGSGKSSSNTSAGNQATSKPTSQQHPQTGPGLTSPTAPSGARVKGGIVTFTEQAQTPPNYIFPMTYPQVCSTVNNDQLSYMLYRPLYWYGNDYSPTVDYSYSVGNAPTWSDGGKTVTVTMKNWKWSDGEPVTSRDVAFWINLYKVNPATEYCGYVPGFFPDNLVSYSTPNAHTIVLHMNKAYNHTWFLYNELSQLAPIPLAWDRTSLSAPAPTSDNGHLPDATKAGAKAVYNFLNAQSKATNTWATSPIWRVVDGPFKLQSFTTSGQVTMVPNPAYSGTPKPSISKLVELPFTSDTAIYSEIRSGGPSAVTIGGLPPQYAKQIPTVEKQGYTYNNAASYSIDYFPLNLNNPTVGPVFRQLYFRQAFQHLVDQDGWIHAFLDGTANPTYSAIPVAPASPLASFSASSDPYPYSTSEAATMLKDNGWKVVPNGKTTCAKPGTAAGDCGAGIRSGEGIAFNIDYQSGVATLQSEMNDLQSSAKSVGIVINLTNHPFDDVVAKAVACTPSQSTCKWTAQNWGAGWIYGPDYLPTGEILFGTGSPDNYGSFSNPTTDKLIDATIYGKGNESAALTAFAQNIEKEDPVVFGPTQIGTYSGTAGTLVSAKLGGYAANAVGLMNPEDWYFTK